ncbi:hypothetical protein NG796_21745 [Laspinema sp. A4]|uniref:hypothetical protein n=1 Tax=Laspinema sp. D2d TaxID=2953686 RepID=UPI0021BA403D|nr:hypothetical protein [Laspinema sp. D2d]MCT7985904.1 hypothetical protein [Laspinema sp. D2d]
MSLMPWRSPIATSRQNSPNLPQERVSAASPRQIFSHHHLSLHKTHPASPVNK